jgi:hypothetical protein
VHLEYTDLKDWTGENLQSKQQSKEESEKGSEDTHVEFCEPEGLDTESIDGYIWIFKNSELQTGLFNKNSSVSTLYLCR